MKKNLFLVLALCLLGAVNAKAQLANVLPKPQIVRTHKAEKPFKLKRSVVLSDPTATPLLREVLTKAGCRLVPQAKARIDVEIVDRLPNVYDYPLHGFPCEGYALDITPNKVTIKVLNGAGTIRAAQTLAQMAGEKAELEAASIEDWPAFKLRGVMHDVGRSFISFEELKHEIDLLSRFKVNTFHWHLTENLAWRFEVKAFPYLTQAAYAVREPGCFYTQAQCSELEAYAAERGVTIIPEIDMPGHSQVFTRSMGFDMQTEEGRKALRVILKEVGRTFPRAPYIHIGGDEVTVKPGFLEEMAAFVRDTLQKKVVVWNPIRAVRISKEIADMTQMWSTAGRVVEGMPNIDCRYNYINHFDVYADLVGIFKSNIYYADRGNENLAGAITAIWNDTKLPSQRDIIQQNNFYANALATAERAWQGGGKQYIEQGGTTLPNEGEELAAFTDFERRFLFHKAHTLAAEPVPYVKQTNIHWRITEPFSNDGDADKTFPPETIAQDPLPTVFNYQGKTYGSRLATGGGIYLRHIWHPNVPSFFEQPANGQTAYAWTYVFSPKTQTVGAQIEFYTYSRSDNEYSPTVGKWDRRGSQVWVNGVPVPTPFWKRVDAKILQDQAVDGLTNENFTSRPPVPVKLKKGWNKVLLKLPHANNGGTGRDKWQFTFVLTTPNGKDAAPGLIYSPERRK